MPSSTPQPLATIKLQAPQPPRDWVKRPRLMQSFSKAIDEGHYAILINAPVGYGKTTCLQEFASTLEASDWQPAWLTLTSNDKSPSNLRRYLLATLERAGLELNQSQQTQLRSDSETDAEQFALFLSEQVSQQGLQLALILDDAHELQAELALQELAALCKYAQHHLLVIVGAHTKLALPTAKLQSMGRLQCFGAPDLQFTLSEAQQLLPQTVKASISESELEQLLEKTGGWPALLSIALHVVCNSRYGQVFIGQLSGSSSDIADYLTEEILSAVSASQRQVLRDIAIAAKLNNGLVEAITQDDSIARQLRQLPSVELLIQNLDSQGYWFKIHPMLRELLLDELLQQPKSYVDKLYQRASQWCCDQELFVEATSFAIDNQQFDHAVTILNEHGNEMVGKGELYSFMALLRRLPESTMRENPGLMLQQAWHHLLSNQNQLSCLLQKEVQQLFDDQKPDASTDFSMSCIESTTLIYQERYAAALKKGLPLLEYRGAPAYVDNTLKITIAASYFNLGQLLEAINYLKQCRSDTTDPSVSYSAFISRVFLMFCYLSQGDSGKLEQEFSSLCQWFSSLKDPSSDLQEFYLAVHGLMAYLAGNLDRARSLFDDARGVPYRMGDSTMIGWMAFFQGRILSDIGDIQGAMQALQESLLITERYQTPIVNSYIRAELVRIALLSGENDTAKLAIRQAKNIDSSGRNLILSQVDYLAACTLLGHRDYPQLAVTLKKNIRHLEKAGYRFQQVDFMLTLAEGYRQAGHDDKARATLEEALQIDNFACCEQLFRSRLAALAPLYKDIQLSHSSPVLCARISALLADYQPKTTTNEPLIPLSKAELKVANCLRQGMTNKDIAEQLFVSVNTVKSHLKAIYAKLDVSNRAQAMKQLSDRG